MSNCVRLVTLILATILVQAQANYDVACGIGGSYDTIGHDGWSGVPSCGDIPCGPSGHYGGHHGNFEFTGPAFPIGGPCGPVVSHVGAGALPYAPVCGAGFPYGLQCGPCKGSKKSTYDDCKECFCPKNHPVAFKLTGFKEQTYIPSDVLGCIPLNWDCMPKPDSPCCSSCESKENDKSSNDKIDDKKGGLKKKKY